MQVIDCYAIRRQVISEGRMLLEFAFDESMRIRSWHFTTKMHREMLPRSAISTQVTLLSCGEDSYLLNQSST